MVRDLITMGIAELVMGYCCDTLERLRTSGVARWDN